MRLPSVSYLLNSFLGTVIRFPIPVLISIFVTVSSIFLLENEKSIDQYSWLFKLVLASGVFFPLFVAFAATREANHASKAKLAVANVLGLGLMAAYWHYMAPSPESYNFTKIARFFLFGVITHLISTFLPYIIHRDLDDFWEYNRKLFINFFIGGLYGFLLFVGIALGISAIQVLFDFDFDGIIFPEIWFVCIFFIHPIYFLSNFPKKYKFDLTQSRFDRPFVNLLKYVFISMVALYMVILYAYGAKILFTWELPEGWVARLVIGFSVVGVLTYLLNYMLPKIEKSGWVKNYHKWFFYILLPVTGLLFVAIWRRVSDYGFTEERYFVVLLGIWLAGICLYFILSKKDDIRYIPISLAIFGLVAAVGGPLSAFSIGKKSQKARLDKNLISAGILKNGAFQKPGEPYDGKQVTEITSIVNYLAEHGHHAVFSDWFDIDSIHNEYKKGKRTKNLILNELGIVSKFMDHDRQNQYFFIAKEADKLDISAYQYFSNFSLNNRKEDGFYVKKEDSTIHFYENEDILETIDIQPLMSILKTDRGDNTNDLGVKQMSHFHNGDRFQILISFKNLGFEIEGEAYELTDGIGTIFWAEKKNIVN